MQRLHQIVYVFSTLAICWFAMMAVHEFGHVLGAITTGSTIQRVVLHPLTISRTDVSPNLNPAAVVWSGPILGCLIPIIVSRLLPRQWHALKKLVCFFAGFCLVANGGYIAIGSFDEIGDCGEMLRTGSPHWLLWIFGGVSIATGFYIWHRLGSVTDFLADPSQVNLAVSYGLLAALVGLLITGFLFF